MKKYILCLATLVFMAVCVNVKATTEEVTKTLYLQNISTVRIVTTTSSNPSFYTKSAQHNIEVAIYDVDDNQATPFYYIPVNSTFTFTGTGITGSNQIIRYKARNRYRQISNKFTGVLIY